MREHVALKIFDKFKAATMNGSEIFMSGFEIFTARPCGALKSRKLKAVSMSGSEFFWARPCGALKFLTIEGCVQAASMSGSEIFRGHP